MSDRPPFWVISLAASRERREFVGRGFADLGLAFETIDAIDGSHLSENQWRRYSRPRALFHVGRGLIAGEVGCSLSHLEACRRVVQSGIPEAVILEDDVRPTPDLLGLIDAARGYPPDWEVVNFDPLFGTGRPKPVGAALLDGRYRVCTYRRNPYGGACYRIRRAAAQRLLDVGYPVAMLPDDLMYRPRPARLRWYGVEPSAVEHAEFRSELGARSDRVAGLPTAARIWEQPVVLAGKVTHKAWSLARPR